MLKTISLTKQYPKHTLGQNTGKISEFSKKDKYKKSPILATPQIQGKIKLNVNTYKFSFISENRTFCKLCVNLKKYHFFLNFYGGPHVTV